MAEIKISLDCQHKVLVALNDYAGIVVDVVKEQESNVTGMFTYKQYRCAECQKIITVLNAVVE